MEALIGAETITLPDATLAGIPRPLGRDRQPDDRHGRGASPHRGVGETDRPIAEVGETQIDGLRLFAGGVSKSCSAVG
ncbi:MAG: hypothetical protein IPK39_13220 [Sulfuritalea sp.]|nr:hypothetical protein [Sulfuritalea sp.]